MEQKQSKKHHYLPRYYLKGFTDSKGIFFVYDKKADKIFQTSPNAAFFENDLNTVIFPKGTTSDFIEGQYTDIENRCWGSNATKYTLPNSDLRIDFKREKDTFVVQLNMMSMEILSEEIDKIHQEGFCGHFPKKSGKNGQGIGMGVVAQLLPLNGAKLIVMADFDESKAVSLDGIQYRNNIFEIHFQDRWIVS